MILMKGRIYIMISNSKSSKKKNCSAKIEPGPDSIKVRKKHYCLKFFCRIPQAHSNTTFLRNTKVIYVFMKHISASFLRLAFSNVVSSHDLCEKLQKWGELEHFKKHQEQGGNYNSVSL